MAVVSIAGSQFTVTYDSVDYSAQVTAGTITATPTVERTLTLTEPAYTLTDLSHEVSITFLYDEEDGFFGAVNTAAVAGTGVTVQIDSTGASWTGTMYCQGLDASFAADGVATASGTFLGLLVLADKP